MQVAITGISGYLGSRVTEILDELDEVKRIVGIDLKPCPIPSTKLTMHLIDVRDPNLETAIDNIDVMIHMAFIVDEIRDKKKTYDINFNGSKNVIDSCVRAGVNRLIHFSSISAYGGHPDNPPIIHEDMFPRGNSNSYYAYTKAEVEHYIKWLEGFHPQLQVTLLRPCVVAGPHLDNILLRIMKKRILALPLGCDPELSLVHEDDLASAVATVLLKGEPGAYNVCGDGVMRISQLAKMCGAKLLKLPEPLVYLSADLLFFLGLYPVSSHWLPLLSHPILVSNDKLKSLGWSPRYSTKETAELTLRSKGMVVHPF